VKQGWTILALCIPLAFACSRAEQPAPQPSAQAIEQAPPPTLGINPEPVSFYTRQWAFVDLMRSSQPWRTRKADDINDEWDTQQAGELAFNAQNYPVAIPQVVDGQPLIVETLMARETGGHYPAGRYSCLYDGDGEIEFAMDGKVVRSRPGLVEVDITPSDSGVALRITRSSRTDPVRNIRLIMPGFEASYNEQVFHPLFLERLEPFKVIRFLDWQRSNRSPIRHVSDLVTPAHATQGSDYGVAPELQAELCNRLGASPWVCIPHAADEECIREMARIFKATLEPGVPIYLEYSNEVWNPIFSQHQWVKEHAPEGYKHPEAYAYFAKRAFDIWLDEFGEDSGRIVRVISGQEAVPWVLEKALEWIHKDGRGGCDAASTAAYFSTSPNIKAPDGKPYEWHGAETTHEHVEQWMRATLAQRTRPKLAQNKAIADKYGVRFVAYESGQHLVPEPLGSTPPELEVMASFQKTDAIGELYDENIRYFSALTGGDVMCHYGFVRPGGRWGFFGLFETQDQPPESSPKYQSLLRFSADETSSQGPGGG